MKKQKQQGFMLLEAMIAILLFSMGIIAVAGMRAASTNAISESKYRMEASFLASEVISKMWADDSSQITQYAVSGGTGTSKTDEWTDLVAERMPGSDTYQPTIDITNVSDNTGRKYIARVTIQWKAPSERDVHQYSTDAFINFN